MVSPSPSSPSSPQPAAGVSPRSAAARPVVVATAIAGLVVAFYLGVGSLLVYATEALLVLFVAVLYGIFLRQTGRWFAKLVPASDESKKQKAGVGLSAAVQVLLLIGMLWLFAAQIGEQIAKATKNVDDARAAARETLSDHPRVKSALAADPTASWLFGLSDEQSEQSKSEIADGGSNATKDSKSSTSSEQSDAKRSNGSGNASDASSSAAGVLRSVGSDAKSAAGKLLTTSFGFVANTLIIFFVGLYLALDPSTYRRGLLKLLPANRRSRGREVLDELGTTLWRWLIGRFATMAITGTGIAIVLALIGVPMPITLGVITGLLTFIPNIGPVIALSLAVLVALSEGGSTVAMTVGGYVAFQLIESYLLTPMIQKKQVDMPPALILVAQLLMGVLCGFLGIAVATPIVAVAMVSIGMLYVEDRLGEQRRLDPMPGLDGPAVFAGSGETGTDETKYRRWQEAQVSTG